MIYAKFSIRLRVKRDYQQEIPCVSKRTCKSLSGSQLHEKGDATSNLSKVNSQSSRKLLALN